ncbi:hypothetical protein [Nocardia crassostreae]|uniref:hypothetical protein n=1 Tax=Nocardia crassostreae TaxID=53428 RepID=UPI001471A9C6|nr:hypothetical protein [Nocardia crassostreae]
MRETAAGERRVALTPDDVRQLSDRGAAIVVERGAGALADFTDTDYRAAGAELAPGPVAVFDRCDVVAWVKPPAYDLDSMPLRRGQVLIGFQDPVQRGARIAALRERGVESIAFERMSYDVAAAQPDPLSAMSRIAGGIAYREGRELLPERVRSRRVRALVLGCGQAGLAAVAAARESGDESPIVIVHRAEQEAAAMARGAGYCLVNPDPAAITALIVEMDPELVVCAAGQRGAHAPRLLDHAALAALTAGAVVVDLTGGNSVATVVNSTVRLDNDVLVTHRSNYPATVPHTASRAYGAATAAAIQELPPLRTGVDWSSLRN